MIDVHTHLHPPQLFRAIRRWFAERSPWDLSLNPTEPSEVAAVLRAAGAERFVFFSYAHKAGMARELNGWLARTARGLDGFGVALATVHPGDAGYVGDLESALEDGCLGLKLHEDVQRVACDDARFDPIYERLAARGAFLLVHVGPIPWAHPRREGLERVDRVLERHPALNVVVAHMGVPDTTDYFELMSRRPRLHLDTTMVFAPGSPMEGDAASIASDPAAIERWPDRVLYGSDYPNTPYPYGAEAKGLESLGLSAPALRAVMHDNAARILAAAESGAATAAKAP